MTRIKLLAAVVLALTLAGCGGSKTAATTPAKPPASTVSTQAQSTSTPATQTVAPAPTVTTAPATTSSTSTTAASGGAGLPGSGSACTAADLTPAFLNSNGATGHVVLAFALKNTSSSPCHTYGFPGVEFLSQAGTPITTEATRTTTDFAGSLPESQVTIQPGSEASFRMVTSDVAESQSACQTAWGLQIYAPDDTTPMRTTMPEGISVCNGTATVSPLVAGSGASST